MGFQIKQVHRLNLHFSCTNSVIYIEQDSKVNDEIIILFKCMCAKIL